MYRKLFIAGLICLTPFTLCADEDLPRSGLYSVTIEMTSQTPMPMQAQTTKQCLKTEDFSKDPGGILAKQAEDAGQCDITKLSIKDGKLELHMSCTPDSGKMTMKTTGSYSTNSYSLNTDMLLEMSGMTIKINTMTNAKRLGDCQGSSK